MNETPPGPFVARRPIVLASGSPRRRQLLADLGLTFDVQPSRMDESPPLPEEPPAAYALRMAEMKTQDVAARFPEAVTLGADTIVALDDRIMGKPLDADDALAMLTRLSGKTHQVISAFCLVADGAPTSQAVTTDVDMRVSGEAELRSYIATGDPMDKAGAYGIQGVGTFLVTGIRGSYTNVVGLPVAEVVEALGSLDVVAPGRT